MAKCIRYKVQDLIRYQYFSLYTIPYTIYRTPYTHYTWLMKIEYWQINRILLTD
jgi:hypothetical protein